MRTPTKSWRQPPDCLHSFLERDSHPYSLSSLFLAEGNIGAVVFPGAHYQGEWETIDHILLSVRLLDSRGLRCRREACTRRGSLLSLSGREAAQVGA
jgi:hypothetical protein